MAHEICVHADVYDEMIVWSGRRDVVYLPMHVMRLSSGVANETSYVVDQRDALCFAHFHRAHCQDPLIGNHVLKAECCCSIGAAWSDDCQFCPRPNTGMYVCLSVHLSVCLSVSYSSHSTLCVLIAECFQPYCVDLEFDANEIR